MSPLSEISEYYREAPLTIPKAWNLSRKHFRIRIWNGKFLKLNKFRSRLGVRELKYYGVKYAPISLYFSVLDWLFPECVGAKHRARYAVPIGGEYVVDVDDTSFRIPHHHRYDRHHGVCYGCLLNSQKITLHIVEQIAKNYSNILIVFSGQRGFHIHTLDYQYRDFTAYNARNPLKSMEVGRFKYSLQLASYCRPFFNKSHFILSTDPLRVISVPTSLNGRSGLICVPIGNIKALERLDIHALLLKANPLNRETKPLTMLDLLYAHPELYEPLSVPTVADSWGGR